MKEVELNLSIDDVNLILEGLGHMPFARVYGLVTKIQEQARDQLNSDDPTGNGSALDDHGSTRKTATKSRGK